MPDMLIPQDPFVPPQNQLQLLPASGGERSGGEFESHEWNLSIVKQTELRLQWDVRER